jgi:hypothetical protein
MPLEINFMYLGNKVPTQALKCKSKGGRNKGCPKKIWKDQLHLVVYRTDTTSNPSEFVVVVVMIVVVLGSKEIFCVFVICCIISLLFITKCHLFHNSIFLFK